MKVKDLTDNNGLKLPVSRFEDPEKELKSGDLVLIERYYSARWGNVARYAKIINLDSSKSWVEIEEKQFEIGR
ncbi:MAG: hypothetical protein WB539_10615 [Planktothrix agardhii]|uniref:hypothetical protein n=1 Tax=Planktothrix agardhii TaxID=1160 RepID=UPI003C40EFA9